MPKRAHIFSILAVSALMISSCTRSADTDRFTQVDADVITKGCGAPSEWLKVEAGGQVQFLPPIDASYEVAACVLEGVKSAGVTSFGFIGNEKYPENEGE